MEGLAAEIGRFLSACGAVFTTQGGLIGSLFAGGLIGGVSHCAGMCGPFVLAQTTARLSCVAAQSMSELSRIRGAALVPYHLGRIATYATLGALSGAAAGGLMRLSGVEWLAAALLVVAAVFFLAYGLNAVRALLPAGGITPSSIGRALARWTGPWFDRPIGWRGFGLGLALGFLPCGLLYGALAAAGAGGSALAGAIGMAAFALGTVPGLVAVGLAGHLAARRFRNLVAPVGAVLMVLNAAALAWFAWRLVV